MRYFGRRPQGVASRSCSQIQAAVGLAVFSPVMADDEEDVEDPKAHRLNHEQVGRPDAAQLVSQEGSPALVVARSQPPPPVPPDGAAAHHNAELQQLAPDAFGSPEGILLGDPGNELLQLGAETGTTQLRPRPPRPTEPPTLPMPAQDRLRLHQTEVLARLARDGAAKPKAPDRGPGGGDAGWCATRPRADGEGPGFRARDPGAIERPYGERGGAVRASVRIATCPREGGLCRARTWVPAGERVFGQALLGETTVDASVAQSAGIAAGWCRAIVDGLQLPIGVPCELDRLLPPYRTSSRGSWLMKKF